MAKASKSRPSKARIRSAAAENLSLSAAAECLGYSGSLVELFSKAPKLAAAWEEGRMCWSVRELAEAGAPDSEIAEAVGLTEAEFVAKVAKSLDMSDLLSRGRVECRRRLRSGLMRRAEKGESKSLREALAILGEAGQSGVGAGDGEAIDPKRVKIEPLACSLFGVSKVTMYDWKKAGCPGFGRGVVDFPAVFAWLKAREAAMSIQGRRGSNSSAQLVAEQLRKVRIQNDMKEGMLLQATQVMADRVGLGHVFIATLNGMVRLFPPLFGDMNTQEIAEALERHVNVERGRLVHEIGNAECLSPIYAEKFRAFIRAIFGPDAIAETPDLEAPEESEAPE